MSDASSGPAPVDPTPQHPPVDVVIMAKAFARAKSRLAEVPAEGRRRLTAAMLHDTLDAVCPVAATVVVVSDEPRLPALLVEWGHPQVWVVPDPHGGLNAAVTAPDELLGVAPYRRPRLAMVADLPGLRTEEFAAVAAAAAAVPACFVADAEGTGTTMLGSALGPLRPRFGRDSAARHRAAGAVPLLGRWPGARRDVDTHADIAAVARIGVGPATRAVLDTLPRTGRPPGTARGARNDPGPSASA